MKKNDYWLYHVNKNRRKQIEMRNYKWNYEKIWKCVAKLVDLLDKLRLKKREKVLENLRKVEKERDKLRKNA